MSKIYSIIVTFNGEDWIAKCLDSLNNNSVESQIIVIDNNSTDNTKGIIKNGYPNIELIESGNNNGFGKANNIGLRKALENEADFVLLLNQDAWIEQNTIERLISCYNLNKNIGIIAPLNFSPNGMLEPTFLKILTEEFCPNIISDLFNNHLKPFYPVNFYVNASCWLISRKCLNIVGGFDPLYNHYGEDVDYCKRAIYHGFEVGICTGTKEFHAKISSKENVVSFFEFVNRYMKGYLNNHLYLVLKDLKITFLPKYFFESITIVLLFLKSFVKIEPKQAFVYFIIFFRLHFIIPKIYSHRIICRKKQPSFLK